MYDFIQIYKRLYGDTVTDNPQVMAEAEEAKRKYDAAGIIAERIVSARCPSVPGDNLPRPSEASTLAEMHERLNARLRA